MAKTRGIDEQVASMRKQTRRPTASMREAFSTQSQSGEVTVTIRVPREFRQGLKRLALDEDTTVKDLIMSRFPGLIQ